MGYHVDSLSDLFVRVRIMLPEIPQEELNAIFSDWMERLQKCIDTNREDAGCVKNFKFDN
jgi:hypothetical protein